MSSCALVCNHHCVLKMSVPFSFRYWGHVLLCPSLQSSLCPEDVISILNSDQVTQLNDNDLLLLWTCKRRTDDILCICIRMLMMRRRKNAYLQLPAPSYLPSACLVLTCQPRYIWKTSNCYPTAMFSIIPISDVHFSKSSGMFRLKSKWLFST